MLNKFKHRLIVNVLSFWKLMNTKDQSKLFSIIIQPLYSPSLLYCIFHEYRIPSKKTKQILSSSTTTSTITTTITTK